MGMSKVYRIGSSCLDIRSGEKIDCGLLLLLGIVMGCLPVLGLRLSTLECFYNSTCLTTLSTLLDSSYTLEPLNQSIVTRFSPILSTTVGTLIDELFIETWENTSNYSAYFSLCAPSTCRYTYVERHSALYTLTTIVGSYGGLTVGLKFLIWHVLRLYWKARQWLNARRTRVEPANTSWEGSYFYWLCFMFASPCCPVYSHCSHCTRQKLRVRVEVDAMVRDDGARLNSQSGTAYGIHFLLFSFLSRFTLQSCLH